MLSVEFNKLTSVIGHEFRHNIVKVAVDQRGDGRMDPQTNFYNGMTKFIVYKRTDV